MALYTKHGDTGETDLFTGQRLSKDALRIEAYGTVDELNSTIGLAAAADPPDLLSELLHDIQSRLFDMGADLATPQGQSGAEHVPRIAEAQATELEAHIDRVESELPAMKHFILPGGTDLAARLHLARTVCRRAERICVTLQQHETVNPAVIVYLNRLSDLLFALARHTNHQGGIADIPWRGRQEAE